MTNDVAIIGLGCTRSAGSTVSLRCRWVWTRSSPRWPTRAEWKDIQFATGGSWTVANPDAIVGMVG